MALLHQQRGPAWGELGGRAADIRPTRPGLHWGRRGVTVGAIVVTATRMARPGRGRGETQDWVGDCLEWPRGRLREGSDGLRRVGPPGLGAWNDSGGWVARGTQACSCRHGWKLLASSGPEGQLECLSRNASSQASLPGPGLNFILVPCCPHMQSVAQVRGGPAAGVAGL